MIKTLTFAVMHFTIAFTVAYLLTGSFLVGGLVATVEPAINTVAYYFHEKFWRYWQSEASSDAVDSMMESFAMKAS